MVMVPMVWLLKTDGTIVVVVRSRFTDVVVQALMHAPMFLLPMVWLRKTDRTMVAIVQRRLVDLECTQ